MIFFSFAARDGMWGAWAEGECSESDCQGLMYKVRACDNPTPALTGAYCDSSIDGNTTVVPCNTHEPICTGIYEQMMNDKRFVDFYLWLKAEGL
jgi:hypothetical protein